MNDSRPNILFVVLDSARPDWLSCYDGRLSASPNIDRLAQQSLLFETAISPSAWTFPSMASVFTGMLPTKHGGHDQHQTLDCGYPTLAEVFARNGYATAAFADVPYVGPLTRLDRGFQTMSNLRQDQVCAWHRALKALGRVHRTLARRYLKTHETRVVFGEAMRWLERRRPAGRPFLLYIHSDETHAPFLPPARYRRRFSGLSWSAMHAINQDKQFFIGGTEAMGGREFELLHALARAEVCYVDEWIGRLMEYLDRRRLADDTVVVIAADHGDNVGEHGLLRHGLCLYDTLLRVPLIVRPPGGAAGQRIRPMVQLIDLMPTLMTLAGLDEPATRAEFQGRCLIDAVRRNEFAPFAVSELYPPGEQTRAMWRRKVPGFVDEYLRRYDRLLRSVRTNAHKLVWASNGQHELYDLRADPGETTNLIERFPALAAELHAQLDGWLASFPHADGAPAHREPPGEAETDDATMARLRDLGYVE